MRVVESIRAPTPLLGSRGVPAYAVFAGLGLILGIAWGAILQVASGGRPATTLVIVPIGLSMCGLLAFATRRRSGTTELVYLHHLGLVLIAGSVAAWATDSPVLATLDVVAAGMALMLSVGRVGCHLGGCCHGRPVRHGIVYEPRDFSFGAQGFAGVPLAPVQLVESAVGAGLAALAGASVLLDAGAGIGLATVLTGYGAARIVTEAWRGDRGRRGFAVANNAAITALALAIAGVVLTGIATSGDARTTTVILAAVVVAAAVGFHLAARGTRLRADDLLLGASMARNAARRLESNGPRTGRSGIVFEVSNTDDGHVVLAAAASPPLSSRDADRIRRTLDFVVSATDPACPPVILTQGRIRS